MTADDVLTRHRMHNIERQLEIIFHKIQKWDSDENGFKFSKNKTALVLESVNNASIIPNR